MRQLETRSTEEPLIKDGYILANSKQSVYTENVG